MPGKPLKCKFLVVTWCCWASSFYHFNFLCFVAMLHFNLAHINKPTNNGQEEPTLTTNGGRNSAEDIQVTLTQQQPLHHRRTFAFALALALASLIKNAVSSLCFGLFLLFFCFPISPSDILGQLSHLFSARCFANYYYFGFLFSGNFQLKNVWFIAEMQLQLFFVVR